MLNKKKFLIISVLAIFIVAMSLSAVSASKTKTVTFKIKGPNMYSKDLKNGDTIECIYENKKGRQADPGVTIQPMNYKYGLDNAKHTQLVKAKILFKKKHKTIKKTYKCEHKNWGIYAKLIKRYKPYKVKVWYKNK